MSGRGFTLRPGLVALALLVGSAAPVHAQPSSEPGAAADAQIDAVAGVYKRRFRSGLVAEGQPPGAADEKIMVEDVVEIVRHDRAQIYFRADLHFYNGHRCGIYGIAFASGDGFVYREPAPTTGQTACTLRISTTKGHLVLSDRASPDGPATCSAYCGARGSLSDYRIERSRRRPIRYLARLRASRQYSEAVAAFTQTKTAPPR